MTLIPIQRNWTLQKCSELLTTVSTMESWNQLSRKGHNISGIGADGSISMSQELHSASNGFRVTNKLIYWVPTQSMLDMAVFQNKNSKYTPKRPLWHFGPSPQQCNWWDNLVLWVTRKTIIRNRLVSYKKYTNRKTRRRNQN